MGKGLVATTPESGGERSGAATAQEGGGDEPRRRRGERRQAGFNDGVERATCAAVRAVPPTGYPVQHRTGVATIRPVIVDQRPGAILLCDGAHRGEHRWPTGERVEVET